MNSMKTPSRELSRKQKLDLIYRHTHRDYKGKAGPAWGEHAGKRAIMIGTPNGGNALIALDLLTDKQIAAKLPYALRRQARHRGVAA